MNRQPGVLTEEQTASHIRAGAGIREVYGLACAEIRRALAAGRPMTERSLCAFLTGACAARGLICEELDGPWAAADHHAANPYHIPEDYPLAEGTRLLIDIWCREDRPGSVYHDLTYCLYIGDAPPPAYAALFAAMAGARDAVIEAVRQRIARHEAVSGAELDLLCREYLAGRGYADAVKHRTGHSITEAAHGPGPNLDGVLKPDHRELLPGMCFSVEPGLYTDSMGARTEVDVVIGYDRQVCVHSPLQREIQCI